MRNESERKLQNGDRRALATVVELQGWGDTCGQVVAVGSGAKDVEALEQDCEVQLELDLIFFDNIALLTFKLEYLSCFIIDKC